jgi:hypothetical protein
LESGVANSPVLAFVDATTWQFYTGGILSNCGTNLNHVSIIGNLYIFT